MENNRHYLGIIVPVFNALSQTKECLASIDAFSPFAGNYEIIIVDNGSEEAVGHWLKQHAKKHWKILSNAETFGTAHAYNQGMAAASPKVDTFLLAHQDVIFPQGVIDEMAQHLYAQEKIGAVVPESNLREVGTAMNPNVPYRSFDELQEYANKLQKGEAGSRFILNIVDPAVMIRRKAAEAAGKVDENFYVHGYELLDYGIRILMQGYSIRRDPRAFVHHGDSSFLKHGIAARYPART